MTCNEVQKLLDAYVDGELDLMHNLEIEQHLQDCKDCQAIYQNHLALKKAIKTGDFYYEMPAGLSKKIHASLRTAAVAEAETAPVSIFPRTSQKYSQRWAVVSGVIAAGIVLVIGSLLILPGLFSGNKGNGQLDQEVVASHIRSLMANHLEDVISTDQHTVKPWFDGKLDFSPPVVDFAAQGYPLIGGRLDYLDQQEVAAVVYQRAKHVINVFIWPTKASSPMPTQSETIQGYNLFHWSTSMMNYWVASDLNEPELKAFVDMLQANNTTE